MVPHEIFRYCETKRIEGKPWYTWKFPIIPKILRLRSGSQELFAYCETKFFDWRTWLSVLMHRTFGYPKISGMLKALPTKFFSTVRPKKSKENRDTPLLSIKVFDVPKILKQRGIPYRALQAEYVKKFNGGKWYHPLRHEIFRKPNFSAIPNCSSTKTFGTLSRKMFDGK